MATTGHLFEEMMATYHSLGIAGKEAGKSSNTQWAFRQLWKKCGVELHQRELSSVWTYSGILSSSVPSLSSPSVRPKRDVRGVSCSRFEEIQHGATVDRVTADGTVMFELWRAS